ncbi:cutinase family protein [Mycobacterium sp.]|uniref:cutinase family protein n=1 Tax=Mycobacterium sp. TaxID=1785 RepID=UPI003F99C06D
MSPHHIAGPVLVAVTIGSAVSGGPVNIPSAQADPCPAVEVAFARGTGQAPGVGNVGQAFIDSLSSQIRGRSLGVYAVNYPANQAFASSAQSGADDLVAHVQDMIGRCPNTRLVLGGFSQGAGVVDLATPALPPQAVDHIAAIAVFGNPTSPLARNLSGAAFAPIGPPYSAKTTDVCAQGDPTCSDGGNIMAHGTYVQSGLTAQAAAVVASELQG